MIQFDDLLLWGRRSINRFNSPVHSFFLRLVNYTADSLELSRVLQIFFHSVIWMKKILKPPP